jgi:PKD repeat protein/photosystem II stability/assembly factor-like uncharacterized protein
MQKLYVTLLGLLFASMLMAQPNSNVDPSDTANYPHWIEMMQDQSINFYQTQRAFELYWAGRKVTKGSGYKPFKRWEAFWATRVSPAGEFPPADQNIQAYQQFFGSPATQGPLGSTSGTWQELGPISLPTNGTGQPNGLGRLNAVAFHPTNSNIIYVGAPSGGLWKTTNGGSTWTNLTDGLPSLGVSSIIVHPTSTNTIFIGTGDRDGGDAPGIGVYKSTDGGNSWSASNTGMGNRTVGMMVMHPSNSNIILAATSGGIYKTTNGGSNWNRTSNSTSHYKDIVFKPGDPTVVYAARDNYFERSTNTGDSWSTVTVGLPSSARFVIGVSPNNANYVYVLAGSSSGLVGLYRSTNSGQSFSLRSNSPNILGYSATGNDNSSQAWYDLCIAVDPTNANIVYTGGINIWKSTNGGTSWSINAHWVGTNAPAVHADHHWLGYSPVNGRLYNGNDGGLYYTANGGSSWIDISSGLAIAQVYKMGQSATSKNLVINGYQDNGTGLFRGSSWATEIGGDGMECIIDYSDTNYMYGALYYGDIRRSTNSGTTFYQIADNGTNGINESGAWVTPYCLNATNSNTMYIGYKNVWRSTNVKASSSSSVSWTKISTFGSSSNLSDIENSPADPNVLYVSRGTALFRSDNVNATTPSWTTLTAPATITDIKAHPTNSNTVYITAGTNIYKSTNKGASWTSIKSNLPTTSMNALVIDKNANEGIYVGTDIGVFYKDASMSQWVSYSTGMPTAAEVTELDIFYDSPLSQSVIRASTYGRGLWTSDLYNVPNSPPNTDFSASTTTPCQGQFITLNDLSSNNPTSWQWSFTPNTVSFASGSTASSQNPVVSFNASGNYSVKLVSTNSFGSDSITKTNYISVGVPSSAPITENFETFTVGNPGSFANGWTFNNTGVFNWRVDNNGTPSQYTGPIVDHTAGTSAGKYMYTEASQPAAQGEVAELISPCISIPSSTSYQLSFWYHMYGADITALNVDIYSNGSWNNGVYTITGQQQTSNTSSWIKATTSMASYAGQVIQVRFRVIRGPDYRGDVAIDDFNIGPPPVPVVDFSTSTTNTFTNVTVSFADATLNVPTSWNWSFSPSTVTYMNSTSATSQNPQVQFTAAGNYSVTLIATNANGSDTLTKTNFISVASGNALPYSENFQTFTVGTPGSFANGWTSSITGNFPWTVNNGGTPSNYTGPVVDHTLGTTQGIYLFTEASNAASGSTAELISPTIDLSNVSNAELKFWYHMYGAGISALNVDINNGSWTNIYTITGQQQTANNSAWLQETVSLQNYAGGNIKVRFRVVANGDYRNDVSIDDVLIQEVLPPANDEPCGAVSLNVGQSCTYSTHSNVNATSTTGISSPPCGGYNGNDVWFKFVAPNSGYANIDAEAVAGSFVDGAMAAYKGSCGNLTYLSCEDDFNGSGNMPFMSLNGLTGGDTIFIRFWKYGGNGSGDFKLCVTEPPYIIISPTNKNVTSSLGSTTFQVTSNQFWTASDNVSWATLSPASNNGNGIITVNYSANAGGARIATITVTNGSGITETATLTQFSNVVASFTTTSNYLCKNTSTTFTNNSTNNTTNNWYIDGVSAGTGTNLTHTFTTGGSHVVKLVVSNGTNTDSTSSVYYISNPPIAQAGNDTSLCEGGTINLLGDSTLGINTCQSGCSIPNYCSSAGNDDNFEYISKVSLNGSENASSNDGVGYEDFTSNSFTVLSQDSTYTLTVTGFVAGSTSYTEYVDAFIDWNRNGLFDEPAISMGSANFTGAQLFNGIVTVPSNATAGMTKMRIILKYNSTIASGCENGFGYGETEDYMIEIIGMGSPSYAWSGPSSFSSNGIGATITNSSTSQSGIYTFTVTDDFGCADNDTKTVTVNAAPNASFPALSDKCINSPIFTLPQPTPSGGTFIGPGVNAGSFNPATAGIGTHTILYVVSNSSGCVDTASQTITVYGLPTVNLSTPSSVCNNVGTINLSGGSPSGGTYSGSGISGNTFNPLAAGLGNKTITYTFTDANGCANTAQSSITVNAATATSFSNPSDVCLNGGNVSLSGGSPAGGTYYGTGVSNGLFSPVTSGSGTHSLYYVYTNAAQCSDTAYANITVVNPPSASLSNFADVCEQSGSITLSGGSPAGGSYFGTNVSNGTFNTANGAGSFTINYVVTNTSSCSDTASATLIVNPLPTVNIVGLPASVCENEAQITLVGSPLGGQFAGTGVNGNSFDPSFGLTGNTVISYTYTDANNCTNAATGNILVQAAPQVNAGSDDTVNYSTAAQLSGAVNGTGSFSYNWKPSSLVLSPNSLTTQTLGLTSAQIFTLVAQNTSTGCNDSDAVTIYISGGPLSLNVSANNQQICQGDTLTLTALGGGGSGNYTYQWSYAGNSVGSQSVVNFVPLAGGYYVVEVNDGINSVLDSVLITVNALPTVNLGGFQPLCEGSSAIMLSGGLPAGGVYSGVGVTNNSFDPVVAGTGSHNIIYTVTDINNCSNSASSVLTVNAKPNVQLANLSSTCESSSAFALSQGSPTGGNYFGNGVSNNMFNPSLAGTGTHTISYAYTDMNQCSDTASGQITVHSTPMVNAGSDTSINLNTSATLNGSAIGGSGSYTFSWAPASLVLNPGAQVTTTQSLSATTEFTLHVSDANSTCSDSDKVLVSVTGGALTTQLNANQNAICLGDSVQITALAGGGLGNYTYTWVSNPVGYSSSIYNPVFSPNADTWFYLTLSDGNSTISDSIFITVSPLPIVNLGKDTLICSGGNLTLDAGSGANSYLWSDNSSNQTLTLNLSMLTVGQHQYSVLVSNAGNCAATDTIVITKGQLPYVNLGLDDSLCLNSGIKVLDAGFGFRSYHWSTGDTTQIIQLTGANFGLGLHPIAVEVSSAHGCTNSDTMMLKVVLCGNVSEIEDQMNILLFPNPSDGLFTLRVEGAISERVKMDIISLQGKTIYSREINLNGAQQDILLNLQAQAPGLYMIRLQGNHILRIERILIH